MRADQLLTSPIFGLAHTRGRETTTAVERYVKLLGMSARTSDEDQELEDLRRRVQDSMSNRETQDLRALEKIRRAEVSVSLDELKASAEAVSGASSEERRNIVVRMRAAGLLGSKDEPDFSSGVTP